MKQTLGIVRYNFFGFFRNPKVIFTFLLEFVLSFLLTGRIMIVMETYDTPVQAIEPFLWTFGDGTAVLLSSLLLLLLFSDLPKMTPVTPYQLIRTTKKLNITQRGLLLYDCASNMLNMRSNIIEEFTGQNKKIIDLAVSTIPSSYLLPGILSAFTCQIPDVYFHSWQSDSLGAVARVLDGSVDLALVGNTFDEPDCCFIPFCKDKLVIATPVNQHYLQYQQKMDSGTLDFSDFLREPFIMRETGSGTKKEIDRYLEKRNIPASSLHIVARMNDLEAIRKSVAGGLGISILSACSAKDLADTHQILMFPLNHESAMLTFYIVYSKNRILKPHVKQFLKFVPNFY